MLCSVLFGQKVSRAYIFMGLVTLAVNVVFHGSQQRLSGIIHCLLNTLVGVDC
jgi:hypothetical protein